MGGWLKDQVEPQDLGTRASVLPEPRYVNFTHTAPRKKSRSGQYSEDVIEDFSSRAKEAGLNPYRVVAQALQETNLGEAYHGAINNPFHVDLGLHGVSDPDNEDRTTWEAEAAVNKALELMRGQDIKYGKDTAKAIQAFEGLGKTHPKTYQQGRYKTLFGSSQPVDMRKKMLYAKEVQQLMKDLMNNPQIKKIIEGSQARPVSYD